MLSLFITIYAIALGLHRGLGPSAAGRFYLHQAFGRPSLSVSLFFLSLLPDLVAVFLFFLLGCLLPNGVYLIACGLLLCLLGAWDESFLTRFARRRSRVPNLNESASWSSAFMRDALLPRLYFDAFLAGGPLAILCSSLSLLPVQPILFLALYLITTGMTRFGADVLHKRFRLVARRHRKRQAENLQTPSVEEKIFQLLILARRLALLVTGFAFLMTGLARLF
ncbi:MAG: hypothetical protein Q4G68_04135 [Planctomycetia bacterium]|nr:hypothetical protein [Planctomycetia bacterium]